MEQQQARLHRPATDSSHLSVTILSAVLSRTVTAPLERVKVIQQTAKSPLSSRAVMQLLVKGDSVRKGLFRGNGLNALRAVPLAALQFSTYDYTRNKLQDLPAPASISMAAACAGVLSVAVTYPLDLLRTRVSLMHSIPTSTEPLPQSQPHAPSQVEKSPLRHPPLSTLKLTRQIVLKEQGGFAALYRGLGLSCVGIVPYMSLSFVLYEAVKPSNSLSYFDKLVAASFATAAAQTATYPFEVVRRMLQVEGMYSAENAAANLDRKPEPVRTAFRIFKDVVRAEGYRGLFRGLLPNLLKVAPATGVSLYIHELLA
ncbi:mitochondrial carrier domain-containing protein [Chytriomyces cf. hyalinus JEL632]|nr:mitochondrial carrier domain-containing protein [Chytriomyces cf. hyalinus JEL632]